MGKPPAVEATSPFFFFFPLHPPVRVLRAHYKGSNAGISNSGFQVDNLKKSAQNDQALRLLLGFRGFCCW